MMGRGRGLFEAWRRWCFGGVAGGVALAVAVAVTVYVDRRGFGCGWIGDCVALLTHQLTYRELGVLGWRTRSQRVGGVEEVEERHWVRLGKGRRNVERRADMRSKSASSSRDKICLWLLNQNMRHKYGPVTRSVV